MKKTLILKDSIDLSEIIFTHGYSKNKFAVTIGLNVATVDRAIKEGIATPKTAKKIADGLNKEITDLFTLSK